MQDISIKQLDKETMGRIIAQNIAIDLEKGSMVNLGVGLPTQVADYVKPEQQILLHAENGLIGTGRAIPVGVDCDPDIISSSGYPTTIIPGAAFFDSSISFGIIRGGHLDVTVLGTMEVDQEGNIANYQIPGKRVTGMGGAMDLCVGSKQVIVATYNSQKGNPKILKKCRLPLTAQKVVSKIVTEKAVMEIRKNGIVLTKYNPMFTIDEIQAEIEAKLIIDDNLKEMLID
ncbi:3-oxoacid CoA-transferase subunit B [Maledivibacter halophilus]|uniref:Butyryl-CoA:acetoacetate CoA-transferase beta subunit n=1 Tax=Maledivibacter halophilus TaxID=36842 RepID=A0A1T5MWH8_9FIRM|nr:3-oxoacid CoA-transferase subunit B [Maledivibacter halophilus]SKC92353.1 butyryl-CoA:acetoacetate CoA-transferase beta subunit [Maledivibacter halophilus]